MECSLDYERNATDLAPSYVAQFSRDGASAGYSMQAVNGEGSYDSMTFYRDGYYNFFLSKAGLALALVSFYFRAGGVVQVQQLQGRDTHARAYDNAERLARSELRKILLHPLLLSYVIDWARKTDFLKFDCNLQGKMNTISRGPEKRRIENLIKD